VVIHNGCKSLRGGNGVVRLI